MKCPICNLDLMIADRQGVEIDYCPKCRGVWLDRGELDKLIERMTPVPTQQYAGEIREVQGHHAPPVYHQEHHGKDYGHHKRKRKSFLEEVFDFD